jgi:hypothetical protein
MISAVDWRNGRLWICFAARIAPSVGLFLAGVIVNNTASVGLGKQGVRLCLLVQFEDVGCDEVAGKYGEQDEDYIQAMQVRV